MIFFRPAFKSGVMIVEDRDLEGKTIKHIIRAQDNGKDFPFHDEDFVKGNYPLWCMTDAEMKQKKKDKQKNKEMKVKQVF